MEATVKQLEAINLNGSVICYAPAGSGKTFTLIERLKRIDKENSDKNILVSVFNKNVPDEIIARLGYDHNQSHNNIEIQTFHSFCLKNLKKYDWKIKVADDSYTTKVIKNSYKKIFGKDLNYFELNKVSNKISKFKNTPNNADILSVEEREVYEEYTKELNKANKIDYDDMLKMFYELMVNGKIIPPKYDYIFIDEFQDFNYYQYHILLKLLYPDTELYCIGDIKQAIYEFRGADSRYMKQIVNDVSGIKTVVLDRTFRCASDVIELSNVVAKHIDNSQTYSVHSNGRVFVDYVNSINMMINKISHLPDLKKALLFRYNDEANDAINNYILRGQPLYVTSNGAVPYGIKILIGYLSDLGGITNNYSRYWNVAKKMALKRHSNNKLVKFLMANEIDPRKPVDAVTALKFEKYFYGDSVAFVVKALMADNPLSYALRFFNYRDGDYIGTIHSFKGKEYDNVVLYLNDNFPYSDEEWDSELKLFYTAITRAKHNLYIFKNGSNKFFDMYVKKYLDNLK